MMKETMGVVVVTHGELGKALVESCRMITGGLRRIVSVSVGTADDGEKVRREIADAVRQVEGEKGTLLLVDMFGGTPSNIGISFLGQKKVEVVTGVNLPMMTKLAHLDPSLDLPAAAAVLRDYGREHIKVAAEYLKG
jgi:PTS system mannose-specific IIA component